MRWIVTFAAVALLCGAGMAQTPPVPGGPPGPATQAPGAQTPGAQTPGPFGAPAATGAKGPAGPALPSGGENQIFIEFKQNYNYTQVNTPADQPSYSFLTPGNNETTDLTLFQDHSWNNNRIQYLGIFRETTDPRVDPEHSSFQRGYFRFYNKNTIVNLGDYLINYSRFTYNQNIKGVSVMHKFGGGVTFLANAGVFTDRWGSIFKDAIIGKPYTRMVMGFRAEKKFAPGKNMGLNFSSGHDLLGSVRSDLAAGLIGVNNQIVSIDSKMEFGRVFGLDSEIAYSWTNPNIATENVKTGDWAARLDTHFKEGPFFLKTNFTQLQPDFLSINARQLADLLDTGVDVGADLGSHVTAEGLYRFTENDLTHQRPEGATIFRVPEFRMSFRRLPHLGRTLLDFGYRERIQTGPFLNTTDPNGNALSYDTSQKMRIPYADFSVPLGTALFSVSYEHRALADVHDPTQSTGTNRVSLALRSIIDLGGWQLSPSLRYELEREVFYTAFGTSDNRNIAAILYVEAPKYLLLEGSFRQVGASLFTQCATTATSQCGSFTNLPAGENVLLAAGFGRPQYHLAATYKIGNRDNHEVIFALDRNSNFFAVQDRAFDERVFSVTLLWRYKK